MSLALVLAVVSAALPSQYTIPGDDVFPEGVSLRPGTDQFFVSSTGNGTIYRGTLGKQPSQSLWQICHLMEVCNAAARNRVVKLARAKRLFAKLDHELAQLVFVEAKQFNLCGWIEINHLKRL